MATEGATPPTNRGTGASPGGAASDDNGSTTSVARTEKVTPASTHGPEESLATKAARRPTDKPAAATAPFEVGQFENGGVTMYYEVHGSGPKVFVFMHGILLDANLNRRLATDLAAVGNRVILLDLPGHGLSDKPRRASYHRMDTYARHVEALLDHLDIDKAVVGGVSLGGNVALLVASQSPERVQGLVVEMPVLEWAVPAAAITFVPMLIAVHVARRAVRVAGNLIRRIPRSGFGPLDSVMNTLSNDPVEIAAVLHGILTGPIAPTVEERDNMHIPALVIGHRSDRIHPFHDAEQLAHRLPDARLLQAKSVMELRMRPERLTGEIAQFLDAVWGTASTSTRTGPRRQAS
jgi:pimeloyl-ACP methyl ester carboxylesterase